MCNFTASSSVPSFWVCSPTITTSCCTSNHRFLLSFSPSIRCGSFQFGSQRCGGNLLVRTHAKFEKFQGESEALDASASFDTQLPETLETLQDEEDDSCLPSDLEGAVRQSSEASATFVSSGGMRAIVELLIPQLQFLDDEGAQGELWELSRIFLDSLIEEIGGQVRRKKCSVIANLVNLACLQSDMLGFCNILSRNELNQRVKAIFPDAGAASLLKYRWKDAAFGFSSLSDRKPVESEDELVVMVVPDYQMLEYVERIAASLSEDPPRPLIMWNPRLLSEDVGVGFNVRNLHHYFLSTFTVVYSMRPFPSGAVFRCYPGLWKVFYDDQERPNRYLLGKEQSSRPDAEELEVPSL